MTAPVLRTERLLLRPWTEADREPFAAMNTDPEVVEFLPGPLTRAESDAMVDRIEDSWATRGYGSVRSTTIGAWSDGPLPLRASRSTYASVIRAATGALASTRSIRMPLFWWNIPAR